MPFCQAQKKTDWEKEGLKGKVKSVKTIEEWASKQIFFDTSGNILRQLSSYDNYYMVKAIYQYDTNGILRNIYALSEGIISKSACNYDERGVLIGVDFYYWLDDDDVERFSEEKQQLSTMSYIDECMNCDSMFDKFIPNYIVYKYDEKGNIVEVVSMDTERIPCKELYEYNDANNIINEKWYRICSLEAEVIYEYDNLGTLIKKIEKSDDTTTISDYEDTNDSYGNWIERKETMNRAYNSSKDNGDISIQTTKRTIEYYE
jgi:hypothetical protein